MKIAILSDTHNNLTNLDNALTCIRLANVTTVFHCGDMTTPETARHLAGFQVHFVYGNGDFASGEISETLQALNPENSVDLVFTGNIAGTRIAALHGHIPGQLEELVESRLYEFIFQGHSHRQRDVRMKDSRIINPGALGGMSREARQFCLLDLATGKAEFIHI
jgi:putative phosphoesterase